MKKSLILSVVMTLVLVISMSTATFAWYTSNDTATITANTITAQSTSGNLRVSVTPDTPGDVVTNSNGSQAYYTVSGLFEPAAPVVDGNISTASDWVHNTDPNSVVLKPISGFDGFVETGIIEVEDDSMNVINFKVDIDIVTSYTSNKSDGDFACIITNESNGKLAWTSYNTATKSGENYSDTATGINAQTGSADIAMNATGVTLKYYIWFNGKTMSNADGGINFSVKFTFTDTTAA